MKRILLLSAVIGILASATRFLAGQSEGPNMLQSVAGPSTTLKEHIGIKEGAFEPLQQRFLNLSIKKARLMNQDELRKSIDEMERELDARSAAAQLEQAKKMLATIVERHAGTEAAKLAQAALDVMEVQRTSQPGPVPAPKMLIPPIEKRPGRSVSGL
jgi:hypothetical protein